LRGQAFTERVADRLKSVPENISGEFFVDSTCIDCDTCRQLAPATFAEAAEYSYVHHQPADTGEKRAALQALVACPTASIGAATSAREAVQDFPLPVEAEVSYCGFASEKSFGGSSYFVRHPAGNWLIDSPRWTSHLVRKFHEAGGLRYIFLTHRDDVADAAKYAREFQSERIIHKLEKSAQPDAETLIEGRAPVQLADGFLAIPTPGHTRGHTALLYRNYFLFTGDHLWWSRNRRSLNASRSVCWYNWEEQVRSVALLADYDFHWVLPGHGERIQLDPDEAKRQLRRWTEQHSALRAG
jgi:glyoxylase-like metal-dependent hydrolase (beta-lactamase superfamily II)/ferredoxin